MAYEFGRGTLVPVAEKQLVEGIGVGMAVGGLVAGNTLALGLGVLVLFIGAVA